MCKTQIIITTLLAILCMPCLAQQKEYIVSYTHDTIYGEIKRKSNLLNPSKVDYKIKLSNGARVDIDPREIKYIKTFNGVDGNSLLEAYAESSFVKLVLDGRIRLYHMPDSAIHFISKDQSDIKMTNIGLLFTNEQAHKELEDLLLDNRDIYNEFMELKGTFKNIRYIIEKYNSTF